MSTWRPVSCRFIEELLLDAWGCFDYDSSDRLAQVGGLDVHGLPVFGDGAARDLDSLLGEDVGDAVVGERLPHVLGGDQLLDERADRGGGAGAARVGGDVAAE